MVGRVLLALLLVTVFSLLAYAQPTLDEAWLTVRVTTQEGKPFPFQPAVRLFQVTDVARTPFGRVLPADGHTAMIVGLAPGKYEVEVAVQEYGLTSGAVPLTIVPGPNTYTWKLPPLIPVRGRLQTSEATPPTEAEAYLQCQDNGRLLPAPCDVQGNEFRLMGVPTGRYRMLLLTDRGYGLTSFTASAGQTADPQTPVTLLPGGVVRVQITDEQKQEIAGARIVFSRRLAIDRGFNVSLSLVTDASGRATTLALPPGVWRWAVVSPGYQRATGVFTLLASGTLDVPVSLAKR